MNQLTTQELEAIRKRAEQTKVNPFQLGEISVAKRYPYDDVTKLLAEVERLKAVIAHVNDCAEEFYEEENGVYVIPPNTPNRDFLQEIFVITAEEAIK